MQLNNTIDGKVVLINDIKIEQNRVIYSMYEFGDMNVCLEKNTYTFKGVKLSDFLKVSTSFEELCYTNLELELFTDYEISDDIKNWIVETGSTGEPTTVRIYIPATVLNKNFNKRNSLDVLMKNMVDLEPWSVRNGLGSMQYLEELLPQHLAILQQYPDILIEYK